MDRYEDDSRSFQFYGWPRRMESEVERQQNSVPWETSGVPMLTTLLLAEEENFCKELNLLMPYFRNLCCVITTNESAAFIDFVVLEMAFHISQICGKKRPRLAESNAQLSLW